VPTATPKHIRLRASPELTIALAIAGRLDFNPATDTLPTRDGQHVRLDEPHGYDFPPKGFAAGDREGASTVEVLEESGLFILPSDEHKDLEVVIDPQSTRLQRLEPFAPWDGNELEDMPLLIKTQGKCTTDHISMADRG
jgi:aconitate hydratase